MQHDIQGKKQDLNGIISKVRKKYVNTDIEKKIIFWVFILFFVLMFWRIGDYPSYLNDLVEHQIHVQVNKVFENADVSGIVKWNWASMHGHGAFESPVFSAVVEIGLRVFGLTILGVRLFPALIEYFSLILVFFAFKRYFSKYLLFSFLLLMGLSPWHLMAVRAGSIYGLSISMFLISLSMFVLLLERKRSVWIALIAGISAGIIPYGYSSLRLLLPLLLFLAIINYRKFEKFNFYIYMSTILVICSIQISNFPSAIKMYFFARGEGLNNIGKLADGSYNMPFIIQKLKENFVILYKMLVGSNSPESFWNVNIAANFWSGDVVLYPKFLFPFLAFGFICCLVNAFLKKKPILLMPILLFFMGCLPNMMSGVGNPNIYRSMMLLVPIYFLIAYGIYVFFGMLHDIVGETIKTGKKRSFKGTIPALFLVFVIFISVYQLNNFYHYEKDTGLKNDSVTVMYNEFLKDYITTHPDAKILLHEFAPFNEYSYVMIRWDGGQKVREMIDESKMKFLTYENRDLMERLIKQNYFDVIVSTSSNDLEAILKDTQTFKADTQSCYKVYYPKSF